MLQRVGIAAGHRGANLRDQFRALFEEKLRHFTKQLLVPAEALERDSKVQAINLRRELHKGLLRRQTTAKWQQD